MVGQPVAVVVDRDDDELALVVRAPRLASIPTAPPPPLSPCSTAFWTSSLTIIASAVASSARTRPRTRFAGPARGPRGGDIEHGADGEVDDRVGATVSSTDWLSVSWTTAIVLTRRTASSSAARASGLAIRRLCSRSSAATDWRLFFTR